MSSSGAARTALRGAHPRPRAQRLRPPPSQPGPPVHAGRTTTSLEAQPSLPGTSQAASGMPEACYGDPMDMAAIQHPDRPVRAGRLHPDAAPGRRPARLGRLLHAGLRWQAHRPLRQAAPQRRRARRRGAERGRGQRPRNRQAGSVCPGASRDARLANADGTPRRPPRAIDRDLPAVRDGALRPQPEAGNPQRWRNSRRQSLEGNQPTTRAQCAPTPLERRRGGDGDHAGGRRAEQNGDSRTDRATDGAGPTLSACVPPGAHARAATAAPRHPDAIGLASSTAPAAHGPPTRVDSSRAPLEHQKRE